MSSMDKELISIIVPVYNVEDYLERCVNSILNQTYSDFEILLIDDGSTDSSSKLCDILSMKDRRIKPFHKNNGGLGSARNYGIDHADGKYVCFVDSDDEVEKEYLFSLYTAMKDCDADLGVCGYYYSSGKYHQPYCLEDKVITAKELLERFACGDSAFYFSWNKLYKRELIQDMNARFSDRHCAEDMLFNSYFYRNVSHAVLIQKPLYIYYVNSGSLSNKRRPGFWNDMIMVYETFIDTCNYKSISDKCNSNLLAILLRNSVSNYFNSKTSLQECKQYINDCLEYRAFHEKSIETDKLGRIDRFAYYAFVNKKYWLAYMYMKLIKQIKSRFFRLFCKLRGSIHRERSK